MSTHAEARHSHPPPTSIPPRQHPSQPEGPSPPRAGTVPTYHAAPGMPVLSPRPAVATRPHGTLQHLPGVGSPTGDACPHHTAEDRHGFCQNTCPRTARNACPQNTPAQQRRERLLPERAAALEMPVPTGLGGSGSIERGMQCWKALSSSPLLLPLLLSSATRSSHTVEIFPAGSPPSLRSSAVLVVLQYSCRIDMRCTGVVFSMHFGLGYSTVNSLKIK